MITGDGEVFGRYVLLERLGVGGMASVHRAKTQGVEGFETTVALKRILPHLAEDRAFVRSFVREAKLAALLHHPNIVRIHDFGKIEDDYFLAMEYIQGNTLLQILRWMRVVGPPPMEVALSLLLDLCEALDYAHSLRSQQGEPLGIVHRDLSPSNLIVEETGHLKVIDFGIAKAASGELRTQSGLVKGKHGYMSPEALRARGVDSRSDLFSVGVIAHELLTGRRLFRVRDDYQTLQRIMRGAMEPPSTFNPQCPPQVDELVLKALARNKNERWQSAGELRDAVEQLAVHLGVRPSSRRVAQWVAEASQLRSVRIDPDEPPTLRNPKRGAPIKIQMPLLPPEEVSSLDVEIEVVTGSALTPLTPSFMQTPVTPMPPEPELGPYIVFKTPTGAKLTMLEGDPKPTSDLRSLPGAPIPAPVPPARWPSATVPPPINERVRATTNTAVLGAALDPSPSVMRWLPVALALALGVAVALVLAYAL